MPKVVWRPIFVLQDMMHDDFMSTFVLMSHQMPQSFSQIKHTIDFDYIVKKDLPRYFYFLFFTCEMA
jgi:hypothetical protein